MNLVTHLHARVLCPFQTLVDLAEQLAIPDFKACVFKPAFELNTIHDWVNIDDSVGDLTAIRAKALTIQMQNHLLHHHIQTITLHVYLESTPLTQDNMYTFIYLAHALRELTLVFYITPEQCAPLQSVTQPLLTHANTHLHYRPAHAFLEQFSKTSTILCDIRHQHLSDIGFDFYHPEDHTIRANPNTLGQLIHFSWMSLKAGAYPLGCRLLEWILNDEKALDIAVREALFMHLHIIRFLSHQHHLVVEAILPERFQTIDNTRLEHLCFIKAFSATLMRNLPVAETYFQKANIHKNMALPDDDAIYKLNLFALFQVVKGDLDTAFALENTLLNHMQTHHIQTDALHHVVLINLARLYKRKREYSIAAEYYAKAYAQFNSRGLTAFDNISQAMDEGMLFEAQGLYKEALCAWINAATHWLTCENPYSLAHRPRQVLCQEKAFETLLPLSRDKVSLFLLNKIQSLGLYANMTWAAAEQPQTTEYQSLIEIRLQQLISSVRAFNEPMVIEVA